MTNVMEYFNAGQKIRCLNNESRSSILPIEIGNTYTVKEKYKWQGGSDPLQDLM